MKKGILVVSFGSSYETARTSCIDPVVKSISDAFSQIEVRSAFTSRRIIKKLKDRDGVEIENEIEAIDRMVADGFEEIFIQPLHIMPGYEYEKIERAIKKVQHHYSGKLRLGEPLLFVEEDYEHVVDGLEIELNSLSAAYGVQNWLLMGHGTRHFANATYSCLQLHFDMHDKPLRVAALESFPNLEMSLKYLEHVKPNKLGLVPFMLVAGDHAINDMAGEEEDSWVNVLKDNGFDPVPVMTGLGAMKSFQKLFVDKTRKLLLKGGALDV